MSNVLFSYRNQLSSEQFNRRFADLLGGSVLSGFLFELGTQLNKVSLVRGADASSLLVAKNGVRIESPSDLIDVLTIEPNLGTVDRMDSVYAHYIYGTIDAVVSYIVVKGDDAGNPAMLEDPLTHTLLGYIKVPANNGTLTAESLLPREVGLALLTVAGEAVFKKGFTSKDVSSFEKEANFNGAVTFNQTVTAEQEPATEKEVANKGYVDGLTKRNLPFDIVSSQYTDAGRVFQVVEQKRPDGTLSLKSTLSNPDANDNYQTLTVEHYGEDGTTVVDTQVWTLTYDANFNIVSKVIN